MSKPIVLIIALEAFLAGVSFTMWLVTGNVKFVMPLCVCLGMAFGIAASNRGERQ